jgi:hypothetical protein
MNANKRTGWRGIALSLALASLLGILVYVTLAGPSTAAADNFPGRGNGDPILTLLSDTDEYTSYLPFVSKPCPYQSIRPPLQGTANFPGVVEILTPLNCTTGVTAESRLDATGTYTGTPANVILWVLAYSPEGLYYPQSPNAREGKPPLQVGGYWQVPLYLGKKGGPPEWFDIVVILTDEAVSQWLGDWVKEGYQNGEYEGISADLLNLMAITEKRYIVVQTAD